MTNKVVSYNNTWATFIGLSVITNIVNVLTFRGAVLGFIGTGFLVAAALTVYLASRKNGIARHTITSRPNSLFSLAEKVFNRVSLGGLGMYALTSLTYLIGYSPVFAITRYLFLVAVCALIYMWNTGYIRHS